ncbi:unnamed protein product [Symbiodinium pilosum]|uniref:Uncharacterized protein n=1 Tax=Symbiodinium pilosum TaxID=2952 RepID=A0A812IXM9_SYMPI|nr:unnamed protein product [Symbiodinium pilosum]
MLPRLQLLPCKVLLRPPLEQQRWVVPYLPLQSMLAARSTCREFVMGSWPCFMTRSALPSTKSLRN